MSATSTASPDTISTLNSTSPLLQLKDVRVNIDTRRGSVHALQGVNLEVYPGETLGIVGESGSGKTMTALALMGLMPPAGRVSGGEIVFDGQDLLARSEDEARRARGTEMGMIFQDPLTSLNPTLTIGKQVMEPLRYHLGVDKKTAWERAVDTLRRVGMPRPEKVMNEYPHQLSGGMRQRVMIAIALICNPKLLIADEPTTALDVTTQRQILDLLDSLKQELDTSVILITHDMGVVAGRTDRIAVMYAGQIVETGTTLDVFRNPQHQYTRALIAALPEQARQAGQRLYSIDGQPPRLTHALTQCAFAPRCQFAQEKCFQQVPQLEVMDIPSRSRDESHSGPAHVAACFFPGGEELRTEELEAQVATTRDTILLDAKHIVQEYPSFSSGVIRRRTGTVHAVSDVSMTVHRGETLGVVGESGCGKSTLGRVIAALETPVSGEITFDETNTKGLGKKDQKRLHRLVQMMFQDSAAAMDPRMRVDEILTEPLRIQGVGNRSSRLDRAVELLDSVGLPHEALYKYPHEFSGGQLQRIGLARALALNPALIVCDEPVSALDVSVQAQVLNLMKDVQSDLGLAYIFISHDLSVVRYISDRVAVMYLGTIVEFGDADAVVGSPRHPYTKALVESVPVADPERTYDDTLVLSGEPASAIDPPSGCRFRTRCPFATEACLEQPVLTGPESHQVACHHPLPTEFSVAGDA